jgi:hypothetical protein
MYIKTSSSGYWLSNKNHYPVEDAEIVGGDRSIPKLAHLMIYTMAGSDLKSAKIKSLIGDNRLPCIDRGLT